jgi:predicted cupin superfamily sugar epimerase
VTGTGLTAERIIALLGLRPHPEGGRFAETYRHAAADGGRGAATAIYFLLRAGERSHWHRVDADEMWHWYAGAPLLLEQSADGRETAAAVLGPDLEAGQRPQRLVRAGHWQAARSLGDWTLVGCTVSPAFQFSGFELAPAGWEPCGERA